jgi:hypothetical protein
MLLGWSIDDFTIVVQGDAIIPATPMGVIQGNIVELRPSILL